MAQENIAAAHVVEWKNVYDNQQMLSRYFVGVEHNTTTNLVRLRMSQELLDAYPEDDGIAANWIETGNVYATNTVGL